MAPSAKAARTTWWMGHYSGETPKRHYAWSNSLAIHKLNKGKMQWKVWKANHPHRVETVKRWEKDGKVKYQGTQRLRNTEFLDLKLMLYSVFLYICFLLE